jgi:hypothetical protein
MENSEAGPLPSIFSQTGNRNASQRGACGNRTRDLMSARQARYLLRQGPIWLGRGPRCEPGPLPRRLTCNSALWRHANSVLARHPVQDYPRA